MTDLIKYIKIFRNFLIGNRLSNLKNLQKNSKKKINKKILIPISTGGLQSILTFESLIGNILESEGCEVDFLLCDEILPACVMATIFHIQEEKFNKHGSKKICSFCFLRAKNYIKSFNGNVIKFSDLISQKELEEINDLNFDNYTFEKLKKISIDEIPVGEHANSGTIRYFTGTNFEDYKNSKSILIKYLKSAIITKKVCENLFSKKKYDEIFINHGIYVPQGVVLDCAKKNNIGSSTWCYGYRTNSVWITRNDTYHKALLHEEENKWNNFNFTRNLEEKLDKYLQSRWHGSEDWEFNFENPIFDADSYFAKKGISNDKPIVALATNMLWDAQVYFPTNFFSDMLEWLFFTIDYFKERPDIQLVIRIHPAEASKTKPSKQRVEDSIIQRYKKIPKNIFLIRPEDNFSTYALLQKSNCLIVYASKIATESAASGIPTIVCGESFISHKLITNDIYSKEEYLNELNKIPLKKNSMNDDQIKRAKKYAYYFWFRRTIPINSFYEKKNKNPNVGIKNNYLELYNKKLDPGLNMVINSLIEGKDYIFEDEKY